eukprot:TRINITY_DN76788_c0_g1_i1.p1 TRINITY_DN76788_c0_g1~~TRINITY_DN76788_c0_g1_i1.p1  ORF type:complete len:427 (-),score=115.72 TRINITY_DN76788_c0_g1_i1:23-1303(-)
MDSVQRLNLLLISLLLLCSAICLTILVPFYSAEALGRGVTVTQSGQVIGSIFIVNIILTPLVTRYIPVVGARTLLLAGCMVCAVGNIGYSLLATVWDKDQFFFLSLLGRVVVGAGDSAISATAYTLAGQQAGKGDQGKVLGLVEACFGVGTMIGPCVGGFLYQRWGFGVPFMSCGIVLLIIGIVSCFFLTNLSEVNKDTSSKAVTWSNILMSDGVMVSMVMVVMASSAFAWYTASLAPYLSTTYGLSVGQTGLVLMVNGLVYTSFTPVFGWLTDTWLNGLTTQIVGNLLIAVSYMFIGPIPPLQAQGLGGHVWVLVVAVGVQGLGSAALYLGSLLHMMRAVAGQGEQSHGMVSSLWCMAEWGGAYAGASLGSWSYDTVGFATGTMVEGGLVMLVTILVMGAAVGGRWRRKKDDQGSFSGIQYKPIV